MSHPCPWNSLHRSDTSTKGQKAPERPGARAEGEPICFRGLLLLSPLPPIEALQRGPECSEARASSTAEETISAMEDSAELCQRGGGGGGTRQLQQVYKLNRKEAAAYMYYVWGSGVPLSPGRSDKRWRTP